MMTANASSDHEPPKKIKPPTSRVVESEESEIDKDPPKIAMVWVDTEGQEESSERGC